MVEIMKADNGYIVLDDTDGVRIESDFNKVIDWLRNQFNECNQLQSILDEAGVSNEYYITNNMTSDNPTTGIQLKPYPVTLDVRPTNSILGT